MRIGGRKEAFHLYPVIEDYGKISKFITVHLLTGELRQSFRNPCQLWCTPGDRNYHLTIFSYLYPIMILQGNSFWAFTKPFNPFSLIM